MGESNKETKLELDRLVFFSDAVVAIAITLLALDLKIDKPAGSHLSFADLANAWPKFNGFFLSFLIIAIFWRNHHKFFSYIREIDSKMIRDNIRWLLFIVLLPFTSSLISIHFADTPAIFLYCLNVLLITFFQNRIWGYVTAKPGFLKEKIASTIIYNNKLYCNVAMINAIVATALSFISPLAAFLVLFARLPLVYLAGKVFKQR